MLQGLAFPALGRLKSGNKIRVPAFYNLIKLVSGSNLAHSFISCKRIFQLKVNQLVGGLITYRIIYRWM